MVRLRNALCKDKEEARTERVGAPALYLGLTEETVVVPEDSSSFFFFPFPLIFFVLKFSQESSSRTVERAPSFVPFPGSASLLLRAEHSAETGLPQGPNTREGFM